MDALHAIYQRRAVKQYDPEHTLTAKEEEQLLEAAIQSPTSFNMQNWRFVLIKDKALRTEVREVAWGQPQVTDASLLIVLTAQLRPWADPKSHSAKDIIINFYQDQEQLQRDEAIRSCGIAAQTLMLTAKAMGYDSCPMIGFDPEAVAKLIQLPEDHVIGMLVVVGKGLQTPPEKASQLPLSKVVLTDKFA